MNIRVNLIQDILFLKDLCQKNILKGQLSITYGVLKDIFSIIKDSDQSERPLSLSNIPDCLNLLSGRNFGNLVKKPCSFLSKVKVYQKQSCV